MALLFTNFFLKLKLNLALLLLNLLLKLPSSCLIWFLFARFFLLEQQTTTISRSQNQACSGE